jgi:NADH-quinone oxidoreductase subunit B
LSWAIGPQGVIRPEMPAMRVEKREERKKVVDFRTPDTV